MPPTPDILCIGSVLWDVIGRSASHMRAGSDVPGRISRHPGGVAMNIAMTLKRFGMTPTLLTAIGRDAEGDDLLAQCDRMGLGTQYIYRSDDLPTDRYMAIEGANGLIAAIADAHSLEAAGVAVLGPLLNGVLGSDSAPFRGKIIFDGNLPESVFSVIADRPFLGAADLCVAPASPSKAPRIEPLFAHPRMTLYANLEEANRICRRSMDNSAEASARLLDRGAIRAIVTNGGRAATDTWADGAVAATPPTVSATRVTGAGDSFMAAHIAAEARGEAPAQTLQTALQAAAAHVSAETDL